MGKLCLYFGGSAVTILVGYAAVAPTNPYHWSTTLLLILFVLAGIGALITGAIWSFRSLRLHIRESKRQNTNWQSITLSPETIKYVLNHRRQTEYSIMWGDDEEWGLDNDGHNLLLRGFIVINSMKKIQVESVNLNIGGQEYASDWQSGSFRAVDEPSICFEIPFDTKRGKRTANLVTIVDGKSYQSESFSIEIPQAK